MYVYTYIYRCVCVYVFVYVICVCRTHLAITWFDFLKLNKFVKILIMNFIFLRFFKQPVKLWIYAVFLEETKACIERNT